MPRNPALSLTASHQQIASVQNVMSPRLIPSFGLALVLGTIAVLPCAAQDASEFVVRLNRLENVSRQMSGQLEQLQYENRQLKEQLRKFQEDVEFRFQEGKGSGRRAPAAAPAPAPAPSGAPSAAPYGTNPGKRGDAFDPNQNPNAPGAPRQLGTTAPSTPFADQARQRSEAPDPTQMVDVGSVDEYEAMRERDERDEGETGPTPVDLSPPTGAISPAPSSSIAATGSGDAQADYEAAYSQIQNRQYEQAEMSLRQFIQSHPRDKLVPKATYWLGESYLQRNRSREAAEQFLKVSTDYSRSSVAPDAMLKLGTSLNALGAKAQACATFAEVERKFPSAGPNMRQNVEREQKRARCAV